MALFCSQHAVQFRFARTATLNDIDSIIIIIIYMQNTFSKISVL